MRVGGGRRGVGGGSRTPKWSGPSGGLAWVAQMLAPARRDATKTALVSGCTREWEGLVMYT